MALPFSNLITLNPVPAAIPADIYVYIVGIIVPTKEEIDNARLKAHHIRTQNAPSDWVNNIKDLPFINFDIRQRKFLPIDVGETKAALIDFDKKNNLRGYIPTKLSTALGLDCLFDLTRPIPSVLLGFKAFTYHWLWIHDNHYRLSVYGPSLHIHVNVNPMEKTLLFFSHPYVNNKIYGTLLFPGAAGTAVPLIPGARETQSDLLVRMNTLGLPINLIDDVLTSQILLKTHYAFTYATCPDANTKLWEAATKWALEQMDLFTIKHQHDDTIYNLLHRGIRPIGDTIDLSRLGGVMCNPLSFPNMLFNV